MSATIERTHWERNRELWPSRWVLFGPQWQAECEWCKEMSDCFDSEDEQTNWVAEHKCQVATVVAEE